MARIKNDLASIVAHVQLSLKILQQAVGKKRDLARMADACRADRTGRSPTQVSSEVTLRTVNNYPRHIWQIVIGLGERMMINRGARRVARRRSAQINVQGVAGYKPIDKHLPAAALSPLKNK